HGVVEATVVERGDQRQQIVGFSEVHVGPSISRCSWARSIASKRWRSASRAAVSGLSRSPSTSTRPGDARAWPFRAAARRSWSYLSRRVGIERMLARQNGSVWHQSIALITCSTERWSLSINNRASVRHLAVIVGRLEPLSTIRSARWRQIFSTSGRSPVGVFADEEGS